MSLHQNSLGKFFDSDFLSDLTIKLNDGSILKVHKILLASKSDFFEKLFKHTPDIKENVFPPELIQDNPLLQSLFEWFYNTKSVVIDAGNAADMLTLADFFCVDELAAYCRDVLIANLDVDNCVQLLGFSYYYPLLQAGTTEFVTNHFLLIPQENFSSLPLDMLKVILSMEALDTTEFSVWKVIREWFLSRRDQQFEQLDGLLPCVRLGLLTFSDFRRLELEYHAITSNGHQLINAARTFQVWKHKVTKDEKMPFLPVHMRMIRSPLQCIVATGGYKDNLPSNKMALYDLRNDIWFTLSLNMPCRRAYHGCVALGEKLYIIGGSDGILCFNTVLCLDLKTLTWAELAPMRYPRCYVTTAVYEDKIFAMGGYDGTDSTTRLKTCERFNPSSNSWTDLPDMIHHRSDASAVAADGKIWIVGGFDGNDYLWNAETFDVASNRWTSIPPLTCRRGGVGCALMGRHVYAMGGNDGTRRLRSVERLDRHNVEEGWSRTSSMLTPRSNFGVCSSKGQIVVAAGYEHPLTTDRYVSSAPCVLSKLS